jgi:hypothetical protein
MQQLMSLSGVPVVKADQTAIGGAVRRGASKSDSPAAAGVAATAWFTADAFVARLADGLCPYAPVEERRLCLGLRVAAVSAAPESAARLQPRCVHLGYCDVAANVDGPCRVRPHIAHLSRSAPSDPPAGVALEAAMP